MAARGAYTAELRKKVERGYGKEAGRAVYRVKHEYDRTQSSVTEDPLAEFVIDTAATAGVGGIVGAVAKKAGSEGARVVASKLAGAEASAGETAAETGVKTALKRVKAAVKKTPEKIKKAPKAVRKAPKRAKARAKTVGSREQVARGAARARKKPVRSTLAANAVTYPAGVNNTEIGKRANAAATGFLRATEPENLPETAWTTARSLPGAVVAPVALGYSGIVSAATGSTKPFTKEATSQYEGVKQIASDTFSGDPKKAQRAFQKEGAGAFLVGVPALTRTKAYKAARGKAQDISAATRRGIAHSEKLPLVERRNRIRHAPKGVREEVTSKSAKHQQRKKTALDKARGDNPERVKADYHQRHIARPLGRQGAPKGAHILMQAAAEYGFRDQKGLDFILDASNSPRDAQLVALGVWARKHPEVWTSKDVAESLAGMGENSRQLPAAKAGHGERSRRLPQMDVLEIKPPEARSPLAARALGAPKDRLEAHRKVSAIKKLEDNAREQARKRRAQADIVGKGGGKGRWPKNAAQNAARVQADALRREAKQNVADAAALRDRHRALSSVLDRYTHPEADLNAAASRARADGSKKVPYDQGLLREASAEHDAALKRLEQEQGVKLEQPIYTAHRESHGEGLGQSLPHLTVGRKEYMRESAQTPGRQPLAYQDKLDRSFNAYIEGTVHAPRLNAAGKRFMRSVVKQKLPFMKDGKESFIVHNTEEWQQITSPRTEHNSNGGQYDPKHFSRLPLREFKNSIVDPYNLDPTDLGLLGVLDRAVAGKVGTEEPSVIVPTESLKEAHLQVTPNTNALLKLANTGARVANRTILGTSPAWAEAQVVAEAVPLLLAKPKLANPLYTAPLFKEMHDYRKTHPEEALTIQAVAGASPVSAAALRTPADQLEAYIPANDMLARGADALTRGKSARYALSFLKLRALGEFDVRRQNLYREGVVLAEADKRHLEKGLASKGFHKFRDSLAGLFDSQRQLSKRFDTREEMWTWLATTEKGRVELNKLTDYVDNIQGNWTSFTHLERDYAPFTIFYPFLRYSLRWTLWTFPKTHPATAMIAHLFAQANANEIEKIIGHSTFEAGLQPTDEPMRPSDPFTYAFPVAEGASGKEVLTGGSRISPGQSPLQTAIVTGKPGAALGSLNPFLGAVNEAFGGVGPFGDQPTGSRVEDIANNMLRMFAPLRAFGGENVLGVTLPGGGTGSQLSKTFTRVSPSKGQKFYNPVGAQGAAQFGRSQTLAKAVEKKYGDPVPSPFSSPEIIKALFNGPKGNRVDQAQVRKVIREHKGSRVAGDFLSKMEGYAKSQGFTPEQSLALSRMLGGTFLPGVYPKNPSQAGFGPDASAGAAGFGPDANKKKVKAGFGPDARQ